MHRFSRFKHHTFYSDIQKNRRTRWFPPNVIKIRRLQRFINSCSNFPDIFSEMFKISTATFWKSIICWTIHQEVRQQFINSSFLAVEPEVDAISGPWHSRGAQLIGRLTVDVPDTLGRAKACFLLFSRKGGIPAEVKLGNFLFPNFISEQWDSFVFHVIIQHRHEGKRLRSRLRSRLSRLS